jgi:hypothetical protein
VFRYKFQTYTLQSSDWVTSDLCLSHLEDVVDAHLLKLQHLQNTVLRTIGNHDSYTPVCELHIAFNISYMYNYTLHYAGHGQK